jgi:hypothetical protein
MWKNGRTATIRSSGPIVCSASIWARFTPMLAWVSITPLGRLVVPLE